MMETETEHHRTVSVDDNDSLVPEPSSTKECFFEDFSLSGQVMNPQLSSAGEVLTKVELDFAFISEKLVNLSLLTMQLGTRENDFESFVSKKVEEEEEEEEEEPSSNGDDNDDSAEKALEFDLLSSILNSEVKELESLLGFLQNEIQSARAMISPFQHDGEAFSDLEGKLHDAEQSLGQLMDQVVEMKKQSSYFQRLSSGLDEFGSWSGGQTAVSQNDGEFGDLSAKIKMQTADQQRNVLRMLEKSLAKEMELEKKLSESRNTERELEMKLYSSEQDVVYMEEVTEDAFSRWLEADNAAEVFKGTAKEMSGKLQILQFNLRGSFKREDNLKSELVDSKERLEAKEIVLHKLDSSNARLHDFLMAQTEGLKESLREAEEKMILLNTENSTLSEKVSSLEEQLNEYGLQTGDADATSGARITDLERVNEELKDQLAKTEARAEEAESKCKILEESKKELQDELGTFRDKGFTLEKLASLEKHLKDSDLQLEHAVAAVEASKEKQSLLYSTVSDMEDVIEDLKSKVLKAENRADHTEEKLIMVSESNAELSEELKFFKTKLKEGEKYLQQAEERKIRTAKDIALHNKIMKKLVMQLAAERERLHKQITNLSRENCVLMVKLKKIGKTGYMESGNGSEVSPNSDQNASSCHQESRPQATITSVINPKEEETESKSDIGSVRRLDVGALGSKYILIAMLVILLSSMAYFISQQNI
ncbi:hypothetical protein CARUB_v10000340mg [Capsella rubella]|uniref:WIT1/2 N-terminal helical bundle domain-containing protein n=1 Tax=Capsella rubella TaxID=81985 RepID=R0FD68_9BRAS|nr:WPP domain-interacting tail-anchored protein 1 isoform X1 [Capsella rubella]EOA20067.1 hypothetical protein CARUB_v10000340mg [Capsella rubella]